MDRFLKYVFINSAALLSVVFLTAASDAGVPLTVWESPVFTGEGTEYYPDDVMIFEGEEYDLVSFELVRVEQEGDSIFADACVELLLEGSNDPPMSVVITLMDDATGNEYEREVPLMKTDEKDVFWSDDFAFEITVTDYDADMFFLGDTYVMAGEDLKDYGEELIESLGLSPEAYCVDNVTWSGAPYEYGGTIMRDAAATGKKLVRLVEATYGGDVLTPAVKGKQYIAYYTPAVPEESEEETAEETGTGEESGIPGEAGEIPEEESVTEEDPGVIARIFAWIKEHLSVVTFGAGVLILAVLGMILLFGSGRNDKPHRRGS